MPRLRDSHRGKDLIDLIDLIDLSNSRGDSYGWILGKTESKEGDGKVGKTNESNRWAVPPDAKSDCPDSST